MKTHDSASDVAAEQGHVTMDGPGGVAVTLTPNAAVETGDRLRRAGLEAGGTVVTTWDDRRQSTNS